VREKERRDGVPDDERLSIKEEENKGGGGGEVNPEVEGKDNPGGENIGEAVELDKNLTLS
jgi:hypothetical protein